MHNQDIDSVDIETSENTILTNSTDSPPCINNRNKVDNDRRHKIILNHQRGMNCSEIAKYENLPRTTVSSIVKKFNETASFIQLPKGGKKHFKITEEIKERVQEEVDKLY